MDAIKSPPEDHHFTQFVESDYDPLLKGLGLMRCAVETGHADAAAQYFAGWRDRLARHLAWEECAVLPACARHCATAEEKTVATHACEHAPLRALADDLADLLAPGRGVGWDFDVNALIDAIQARLVEHRDHEVAALCPVVDRTMAPRAVEHLEEMLEHGVS